MATVPRTQPPPETPMRPERTALAAWVDAAHTVLRVGAGLHGLQKLFGLLGGTVAPLASLLGVAGILEFVGGILLVAGLWTRGSPSCCSSR
jgi:uncharacterized membrane protein YphA (DoxX/SURF4 family)